MQEIEPKDFAEKVKDGNVIMDFFGTGCGNCKILDTFLPQLESEYSNVKFFKVNTDTADTLLDEYGIATLPTLLFFKNGKLEEKIAGLKPKVILSKKINEIFA